MPWPVLWTLTAALISVLLFLRYRKQVQAVNFAWQAPQQASEQWGLKPAPSAPSSATQGIVCEDPAVRLFLVTRVQRLKCGTRLAVCWQPFPA